MADHIRQYRLSDSLADAGHQRGEQDAHEAESDSQIEGLSSSHWQVLTSDGKDRKISRWVFRYAVHCTIRRFY